MQMPENTFKRAITAGKPQPGLWVSLCGNYATECVATAGFDWVLLDMEHSPSDMSTVLGQLQAMQGSETTALVRPYWNDSVLVKRLLDLGASSLLFPMIQNAEEARQAVAATRYPPDGIRGVALTHRGNSFGRRKDYLQKIHNEVCVIVQVETRAALDVVEEIAAVDGVDGVFFGPADISADLGKLGQTMDDEVWEVIRSAAAKVSALGKPVGTLVTDPQFAAGLLTSGFSFVACGTDAGLLARGADQLLATVKGAM
ncbi:MAG: HpcH/HpaI aldolase/citrate lyase family protein [Pseudomonadota bacterium]